MRPGDRLGVAVCALVFDLAMALHHFTTENGSLGMLLLFVAMMPFCVFAVGFFWGRV